MIKRIKIFLAFRLPGIYRKLISFRSFPIPLNKPQSDVVVLMMTGQQFIDLTFVTLISIARTWRSLPAVIISSDGSMTQEEILKKLAFWPAKISIESWNETEEFHISLRRNALISYAASHPFGKKMAFILKHASQQPILWIDSDIIFFGDFSNFIPCSVGHFVCGGSEDSHHAYDERVTGLYNEPYAKTPFNAGMLYVHGKNIYEDYNIEHILKSVHPAYNFCTEQTIFAHIANHSEGIIWPKTVLKTYSDDSLSINPMSKVNVIARHYTSNVRHLFWRDAFFNL